MEIVKRQIQEALELRVEGRLDAYWADHLSASLEDSIRQGFHQLQLNLAQVEYLSSAGIRILLKFYKQLKSIQGSLTVTQASTAALNILQLAGLQDLLIPVQTTPVSTTAVREPRRLETAAASYSVFDLDPSATLRCSIQGDAAKLEAGEWISSDSRNRSFPDSTFGIGLGAFGKDFEDCHDRYGEFLAVSGVAACLPTDGTTLPDYVVSEGALVPEMAVLYALLGKGGYANLLRFEAKPEPPGTVNLAEVVSNALQASGADLVGLVMVAESAGLVGAALKKSPASDGQAGSRLGFPNIRKWLSFTAERAFDRTVCLVVGVASGRPAPDLMPLLRPMSPGSQVQGHFHAAVFPYHPIQRGILDLHQTVHALFAAESIQGLLHLLADTREIDGVGQSEFLRGACWIGAITETSTDQP
jgi:anti-anti-sigma factor